jgi:hypothetical protein
MLHGEGILSLVMKLNDKLRLLDFSKQLIFLYTCKDIILISCVLKYKKVEIYEVI